LHRLGVVPGGELSGRKARIALMFALGAGLDLPAIRSYFAALVAAGECAPGVTDAPGR
jgi:L-asparaginase